MKTRRLSSITIRSLSRVVVACLLMFSLIGIVTFLQESDSRLKGAQDEAKAAVAGSVDAISQALWNYDQPTIKAVLGGLTRSRVIVRAEVSDEQGAITAVGDEQGTAVPDRVWLVDLHMPDNARKIGTLRLYESYARVHTELLGSMTRLMLAELAKVILLAAILFFLIYLTITRHLVTLSEEVGKLRPDEVTRRIELDRKPHRTDELDDLVDAINFFHLERAEERRRRQKAEEEARVRIDELARMGRVAVVQSLSATIAHELNQPLGAILSNAEAADISLGNGTIDIPAIHEILVDIRGEAQRASEIVTNLRSLVEKRDTTMSFIDLNELMLATHDLAKWNASSTPVAMILDLDPALPRIRGNRVQMQQVILNLITNAKEALLEIDSDQKTISIRTRREDNGSIFVSVNDNGPGIADEKIEGIFAPFYTTKSGGTGMGLWISHMIVEQHGGKLRGYNETGGGACFCFSLPAAKIP
jgi:C4-dicarboxylate-specific signal transduction histidine kinase